MSHFRGLSSCDGGESSSPDVLAPVTSAVLPKDRQRRCQGPSNGQAAAHRDRGEASKSEASSSVASRVPRASGAFNHRPVAIGTSQVASPAPTPSSSPTVDTRDRSDAKFNERLKSTKNAPTIENRTHPSPAAPTRRRRVKDLGLTPSKAPIRSLSSRGIRTNRDKVNAPEFGHSGKGAGPTQCLRSKVHVSDGGKETSTGFQSGALGIRDIAGKRDSCPERAMASPRSGGTQANAGGTTALQGSLECLKRRRRRQKRASSNTVQR